MEFRRLRQIVREVHRSGLGRMLVQTQLWHFLPWHKRLAEPPSINHEDVPQKLATIMDRLGGAFIKLGQLLSVRPDLVPQEYCRAFSKLQDQAQPLSYATVRRILIEQHHREAFSKLRKEPLGSASVSQVHTAVYQGKDVVVKVQRPNAQEAFAADIAILEHFASLAARHSKHPHVSFDAIITEFKRYSKEELDFHHELSSIQRFYDNFSKDKHVIIPKPYPEVSSSKVLVLEWLHGQKLRNSLHTMPSAERTRLATLLVNAMLKQVFEDGLFHADLHPGNVLVMPKGKLGLIDFGIVGYWSDTRKDTALRMLAHFWRKEIGLMADAIEEICNAHVELRLRNLFEEELSDIVYRVHDEQLGKGSTTTMLFDLISACVRYQVRMPRDFVMFAKALVTVEGTAIELDPDFRIWDVIDHYVHGMLRKRHIGHELYSKGRRVVKVISRLPERMERIMDRVEDGQLHVEMELQPAELRDLNKHLDKSSSKVVLGLIAGALLVLAGLTIQLGAPVLLGLPALSLIAVIGAIILLLLIVPLPRE